MGIVGTWISVFKGWSHGEEHDKKAEQACSQEVGIFQPP